MVSNTILNNISDRELANSGKEFANSGTSIAGIGGTV
jgi:hypothetical protein